MLRLRTSYVAVLILNVAIFPSCSLGTQLLEQRQATQECMIRGFNLTGICIPPASCPYPNVTSSDAYCYPYSLDCCTTSPPPSFYTWPECSLKLNCTFEQIEKAPMYERQRFLYNIQSLFKPLNATNQYNNIHGVINFFLDENIGQPHSWVSFIDAAILEGIQRGGAIVLGLQSQKQATASQNPGVEKWAKFLRYRQSGVNDKYTHDLLWGDAEEAATNYGKKMADTKFTSTPQERTWFSVTMIYRWILKNRRAVDTFLDTLPPVLGPCFIPAPSYKVLLDFTTDVTLTLPGRCLTKIAWEYGDLIDGPINLDTIIKFLTKSSAGLLKCMLHDECQYVFPT